MSSANDSASFLTVPKSARLRWLVYLRWVALGAVGVGLLVAHLAHFPWVAPRPIAVALGVGVLYNLAFLWRVRRFDAQQHWLRRPLTSPAAELPELDRELELQALADVGALTLLLLASGGVHNPICMFYGFHVVLGAMLGNTRGALLAALVGSLGIGLLVVAEQSGWLLAPPLISPPLWLMAGAALVTIASLAHFALGVLSYVEREQERSLRNYELLLSALERLDVGLELVAPEGRLLLANRRAAVVHPCAEGRWQPPAGTSLESVAEAGGSLRFAFVEHGPKPSGELDAEASGESDEKSSALAGSAASETRIVEMLSLGGGQVDGVRAFLYVDRTEATVDEQRAIMLERLASLGRAMQVVAHELNTPLASIQTLAVDLSHSAHSPDAAESIALIVDEARRCQQISRELLSTARIGAASPVRTVLVEVVRRAVRLTFYGQRRGGVVVKGSPDLICVTDSDRLLQILVNLLQNAGDASDQPIEVTVSRSLNEDGSSQGEFAEIAVRDFGPGLPALVLERLFAPFVSTKPPGQGTGLGLYTCARLAQQLHAELRIENVSQMPATDASVSDAPARAGVLARLRLPLHLEGAALS